MLKTTSTIAVEGAVTKLKQIALPLRRRSSVWFVGLGPQLPWSHRPA